MKIFNSSGSKDRLFEMMERVNKVKLNEEYNPTAALEMAFNDLENGRLNVEHTNTQARGNETFVELMCTDKQGNNIVFTFKLNSAEGDQEGVFKVDNAIMTTFAFDSADGSETIELDENGLKQFNAQHGGDLLGLVSDYADFETEEPEIDEVYQKAVEKIDSYPFGGTPRDKMQTSKAYGDEKPTNPAVRVKAPELDKFVVSEGTGLSNLQIDTDAGVRYFMSLPEHTKQVAIQAAKLFVDKALAAQGLGFFDIPEEQYKEEIKRLAVASFERYMMQMNEEETKEKGDYPDPIGKTFKTKSKYPKKKKKPQTTVKIGEGQEESEPVLHIAKSGRKYKKIPDDVDVETWDKMSFEDRIKHLGIYQERPEGPLFGGIKEEDDDDYSEIPDLEIPMDKGAKRQAMSDIKKDYEDDEKVSQNAEFQFSEGDDFEEDQIQNKERGEGENLIRSKINTFNARMDFNKMSSAYEQLLKMRGELRSTSEFQKLLSSLRDAIAKYFNLNNIPVTGEDVQNFFINRQSRLREEEEGAEEDNFIGGPKAADPNGMSFEPQGDEIEQLAQDKEETGEILKGGKGDNKSPLEFDTNQVLIGLEVEAEHTDDSMVAIEIVLDHLSEDPEYYTRKANPDASAQDGAAKDAEEKAEGGEETSDDDKKMTDVLLGYKPKNVGDEVNGDEDLIGEGAGKKTKMFKIGEYAVGGIIKIDIDNNSGVQGGEIAISALDYNTKQPVQGTRFVATNLRGIDDYLNELTSSYYAGKIMEWIKANTNSGNQSSFGW